MADFDVFNGDADGICALAQLRQAEPRNSQLVTGVKRDISLLKQVHARAGDRVAVLDISMEKNLAALEELLHSGATVFYVDHHQPGSIPSHPQLQAIIDESPRLCTSLLVNRHLDDAYGLWAITGAFGDNLRQSALALGAKLSTTSPDLQQLENLGIYINYNGYGTQLEDLHFHPADLYRALSPYGNPLEFMDAERETFQRLETGYRQDMSQAAALRPEVLGAGSAVYLMPDATWCRRVSGVFGNSLANDQPTRAHAILTRHPGGGFVVSVRAPLENPTGAGELCQRFPTGGGRSGAAGINQLPETLLGEFIDAFQGFYG